jgi:hypothetical protein
VDELFSFSHALGVEYSGEWADPSTFEIAVIRPRFNQSSLPQIGITSVNITAGSPLFGASGVSPVSRTETLRLQGDARLLIPPNGDRAPVVLLPAVREFVLLDAEAGGAEDVVGIGSSVLLRFDREVALTLTLTLALTLALAPP